LAAILRPGNAGSNTAEDHFAVLGLALAQLPAEDLHREILVRTDIGGQTHQFTADCREAGIRFSVGYELTETVRQTILQVPETGWAQAINGAGEDRDGAWVAELTDRIDLSAWPQGTRLICRSERPRSKPPRASAAWRLASDPTSPPSASSSATSRTGAQARCACAGPPPGCSKPRADSGKSRATEDSPTWPSRSNATSAAAKTSPPRPSLCNYQTGTALTKVPRQTGNLDSPGALRAARGHAS